MKREIIKTKIYGIEWEERLCFISLHFNDKDAVINPYRPPDLSEILKSNSCPEEEFLNIWIRFIIGLSVCSEKKETIERSIGALTFTIMDSIMTKGKITFEGLLHHIDCFSMMLKEEGIAPDRIRVIYKPITKAILSNFNDMVIDPTTGKNFIDSPKYKEFERFLN